MNIKTLPLILATRLHIFVACFAILGWVCPSPADVTLLATRAQQSGKPPTGATQLDTIVLANEPDGGKAGMFLDFDLQSVAQSVTPVARLQIRDVVKLKVSHPGQTATTERGILHIFRSGTAGQKEELIGVLPVKAGGFTNSYTIDLTQVVNDILARASGEKKLRLEVRLEGKPLFFEVYGVPVGQEIAPPSLEIAPSTNWSDDWERRVAPFDAGAVVYREACLPLAESRDNEIELQLMYPAKKIIEVFANGTGEKLREGRDWVLRDGKLVLPVGSHAPIQLEGEFFLVERKDKDGGVKTLKSQVKLMEGTWYHEREIEVTYEPTKRDWAFPAPLSSLEQLPRLKKLLVAKAPIKLVVFGDSIAAGGNASKFQGGWPYQPMFGELVLRKLEQQYESKFTYLNHSRAGATSGYAAGQADTQVGWFKPDLVILAYGMNDRATGRREIYRANMESIIDTVRARSPDTEFIVVTPMLNNPKQPTGLDPVLFIRDEALKISRPGVAFVDITTTHLELIKRKHYLDTSGNGANHPNDFLHRIYAQRILEVLLPATQEAKRQ